jgi:hypothetical protein
MSFTGRKHSEETKQKMRKKQLGKNNSFYGKKHTNEVKHIIRIANIGTKHNEEWNKRIGESHKEDKNPMWKGNNVGYGSLHQWIKNHLPKSEFCQICKLVPPYDLANISGKYLRDLKDWQYLCRRCHMKSDGRLYLFNKKNM